jgi:hypothetical protein
MQTAGIYTDSYPEIPDSSFVDVKTTESVGNTEESLVAEWFTRQLLQNMQLLTCRPTNRQLFPFWKQLRTLLQRCFGEDDDHF